jgi:hypothetical protein
MIRYGNMVLPVLFGGEPYMASRLAGRQVTVRLQLFYQILATDVPWDFHAAITSAFTM